VVHVVAVAEKYVNAESCLSQDMPAISAAEFNKWVKLLCDRTGILESVLRRSFLLKALGLRMQELGLTNYQAYYDYLHCGVAGNIEWMELLDLITVHETRFFRHPSSINLVREFALKKCNQFEKEPVEIKLWSVGCATGDEAYTLAIVIDQVAQESRKDVYFSVLASDISKKSLATGRKGIYHARKLGQLDDTVRQAYFTRLTADKYEVSQRIKSRVCFAQLNALEPENYPIGQMDVIFCQNMLIYFSREKRINIVNKLVNFLEPDGILVLGAGEIHPWSHPQMRRVMGDDILAFRKISDSNSGCIQ
jgi:type IV pilus assembly protein PilK